MSGLNLEVYAHHCCTSKLQKNEQGNAGRQVFCFDVFICLYSTYTTLKKKNIFKLFKRETYESTQRAHLHQWQSPQLASVFSH